MRLMIDGEWFVDEKGRKVLLRGINLGGSSKVPMTPNGATHIKTDFSSHREVSFVGRPFSLRESHEHFRRIRHWGFNCLRFVTTWEAIEHAGLGQYDSEYLDYLDEIMKIAETYNLYAFIDPHQDVWSRMSGGDGAPGWTFEEIGIDFTKFDASGAAFLMQYRYNPDNPKAYPAMSWSQNRIRFASATMWTLFFGGKDFASSCTVKGQNIQDFLQKHFVNAYRQLASRLKDSENVLGFGAINEPGQGWIEMKVDGSTMDFSDIMGNAFTPFDAMVTASGYPREVPFREIKRLGIKETRRDTINEAKVSVWMDGFDDIWRKEGVWGLDENGDPVILKNDYFCIKNGSIVDFHRDHLSSFFEMYMNEIRAEMPNAILFFESPFELLLKGKELNLDIPENSVHEPHWYDVATIGLKRFMGKASYDYLTGSTIIGPGKIRQMFVRQLSSIKDSTRKIKGTVPTLIGEFGLCYDLDKKEAYQKFREDQKCEWKTHVEALSAYYDALDANLLHATQWNYTADNNNEWGDLWNLEDFSIFSRDQHTNPNDINSGGRAIKGFCRPHFMRVAGSPLKMEFNIQNGDFQFQFEADTSIEGPTIIYLPEIQFPNGFSIKVSECEYKCKLDAQMLFIYAKHDGIHKVQVSRKDSL